jgi:hypothetical protein
MQPLFIKTSKGFVNLNHVQMVTLHRVNACISFNGEIQPLWIEDNEEEVSQLRVVLDKISLFDITTPE